MPHTLLDRARIASPCSASWNDMSGDDRVRHCGACALHVYNLSAMTADEAETLIAETEGRLCVRLWRRADGTVLTRDCPEGARAARQETRRRWRDRTLIAASIAGLWAASLRVTDAARSLFFPAPEVSDEWIMGEMGRENEVMEELSMLGMLEAPPSPPPPHPEG